MKLFLLSACLFLSACSTVKSSPSIPEVIIKTEVVKIKVPEQYLMLPAQVTPISNWDKITQKDVARWIVETDSRVDELEAKLKAIKLFNDGE